MRAGLAVSLVVCGASLTAPAVVAGLIWFEKFKISSDSYNWVRLCLAIGASLYAIYCVWWLLTHIVFSQATIATLAPELKWQLVFISIVWIIVPPVWFFVEYFAVASNCIEGFSNSDANLKRTKD
jgi:hypothetical protein